jgi:hypothetical protein
MGWEVHGVDRFNEQLAEMARRADKATDLGVDNALRIITEEARHLLIAQSHPPFTSTPSVAPEPPAKISGGLADSFVPERDPSFGGVHSGRVGPTKIYSRIQELGGTIYAQAAAQLSWFVDGAWHHAQWVYIPPRPYLKPGAEAAKPRIATSFRNLWNRALHGP